MGLGTVDPTVARLVYNWLLLVIRRAGCSAELMNQEIRALRSEAVAETGKDTGKTTTGEVW